MDLKEFEDYIAIKSISADPKYKDEMGKAAYFLTTKLNSLNFKTQILETNGYPIVFAERLVNPEKPTILVYGHYDVQPGELEDGWESNPFTLTEREGFLYARGITDNKGPTYAIIKAVENLNDEVNIKFLIEGEEEKGSTHFKETIEKNKELLDCNAVLVSDGLCLNEKNPCIESALRGLIYCFVKIKGPNADLHSGTYGGIVKNPHLELIRLLATCQNEDGTVNIPGFYDDIQEITDEEKENIQNIPLDINAYQKRIGTNEIYPKTKEELLEKGWYKPTFEVHGVTGGYTGEGGKTIIPEFAEAKVSMRLVGNQDPKKVFESFKNFLEQKNPNVEIRCNAMEKAFTTDLNNEYVKKSEDTLKRVFNEEVLYMRAGGSIPAITALSEVITVPFLLIPLGRNDDGMHAANERFEKARLEKGIKVFEELFKAWGRVDV